MRVLLLALFTTAAYGYVYDCLDKCECDRTDLVIHCHNGDRTQLTLPQGKGLRGFTIIGLTYNKIVSLPDEETLLSKFPDLKLVDVERNEGFDCSSLQNYNRVKIISDCSKNITNISRVPKTFLPTANCDVSCQVNVHYEKLHEYVIHLWDVVKEKIMNMDLDSTLRSIQRFFSDLVDRVNKLGTEIHEEAYGRLQNPKFARTTQEPVELVPTELP